MKEIGVLVILLLASCGGTKEATNAGGPSGGQGGRGGAGSAGTAGSSSDTGGASGGFGDAGTSSGGTTADAAVSGTGGRSVDASSDRSIDTAVPDAPKDLRAWADVSVDRAPAPDVAVDTRPACPYTGHVTYTLTKSASPTAAERNAYSLITAAMDKALSYYNCYTDITKAENVSYNPDVPTADGNINGSIRFGAGTQYMEYITAMHEIAHTVGIGTASNWQSMLDTNAGTFTGATATAELRAITGVSSDVVHADRQHFWPYGLNYASEVKSEADVIDHCRMVVAIRKDLGLK